MGERTQEMERKGLKGGGDAQREGYIGRRAGRGSGPTHPLHLLPLVLGLPGPLTFQPCPAQEPGAAGVCRLWKPTG